MSSSADGHPTTAEEMETLRVAQAQPGDVVGSYRVLRLIGEGAVGRVFEVEHVKIGRRAAMKVLSPEHALRPMAVRRLFSEAQAVNRINHPHIVEITDVVDAERPGGASGVVMELLEGQSLAQMMIREGPVPPERFIPILIQVADGLSAAHAAGFVHRDLKPENIFLTERHGQADYVKLLDFGLAKSLAPDSGTTSSTGAPVVRQHQTVEGTFLGTPAYASPEQASGKPVDRRSDLYSLGVILYEMLCGRLPFEGANLGEYLVKHITMAVPAPPREVSDSEAGRALNRLARRCLEKDPSQRLTSAGELKDSLARILRRGLRRATAAEPALAAGAGRGRGAAAADRADRCHRQRQATGGRIEAGGQHDRRRRPAHRGAGPADSATRDHPLSVEPPRRRGPPAGRVRVAGHHPVPAKLRAPPGAGGPPADGPLRDAPARARDRAVQRRPGA